MPSKFNPHKHHRRSIRVPGYDYSQPGVYFVTMVTYQRECQFDKVGDGKMWLNKNGQIIAQTWNDLPIHNPHVEFGTYIIMLNHFHGILILVDTAIEANPLNWTEDEENPVLHTT